MKLTIKMPDGMTIEMNREAATELCEKLKGYGDDCSQDCKKLRRDLQYALNNNYKPFPGKARAKFGKNAMAISGTILAESPDDAREEITLAAENWINEMAEQGVEIKISGVNIKEA